MMLIPQNSLQPIPTDATPNFSGSVNSQNQPAKIEMAPNEVPQTIATSITEIQPKLDKKETNPIIFWSIFFIILITIFVLGYRKLTKEIE